MGTTAGRSLYLLISKWGLFLLHFLFGHKRFWIAEVDLGKALLS